MKAVINQFITYRLNKEKFYLDIAIVTAVNEGACDVEIVASGLKKTGLKLQANTDVLDGWLVTPVIGSSVIVGYTSKQNAFIVQFSDIEKITYQNGTNGGVPITPHLIERLNTIEQDLNSLKTAFTNWTPITTDGGAALKAIATEWSGSQLTETVYEDIANDNLLQ